MTGAGGREGILPIIGTVREGIGFAGAHFEDALRLTWLPVLLLAGWFFALADFLPTLLQAPYAEFVVPILSQGVPLLIAAMYYGPLLRLAARGEAPDHGTAPLRLGWSVPRYALGSVLSLGGAALITAPVTFGARTLVERTEALEAREVAVFAEGSLHAVDFVPAFDASWVDALQSAPFLLLALTAALLWAWTASRVLTAVLTVVFLVGQVLAVPHVAGQVPEDLVPSVGLFTPAFLLISGYLALRLAPLPWFWAARRREDGWPVLRSTLRVSRGGNRFRLLLALALLAIFNFAVGLLLLVVPAVFGLGLSGATALLEGTTALTNGGRPASWVGMAASGALVMFGYAFVVATTALSAGFTAGFGGTMVRRTTMGD